VCGEKNYEREFYEDGDHEIECCDCSIKFIMSTCISFSYETSKKSDI